MTVESFFNTTMRFELENRRKPAERSLANGRADEFMKAAQFDEVHRRMEAVQAGMMPLIAGKDVMRQVREAILGHA